MARFKYKAVSASGEVIEGEMDATTQAAVIERLHGLGHVPIRADETATRTAPRRTGRPMLFTGSATQRDVAVLTRELATLLSADLPLERSLEIVAEVTDRNAVRGLVRRVLDGVRQGSSLADAMAAQSNVFSRSYLSAVHAGEVGAALDVVLARLATFMEKSQALRESVKSALIYPAILLAMAGFSIIIVLTVVLPEFKPLFEDAGAALPAPARFLMGLGDLLQAYGWLIVLVVGALWFAIRAQLRHESSRRQWDRWLLRLPLVGDLVTKIEVARFSRTLSTLLANGVDLLNALSIAGETVGNSAVAATVKDLIPSLKEGRGMAESLLQSSAFPRLAAHLIRVGEESGQLETMLTETAEIFDREVQLAVERAMAFLVPVLTIVLGLLVAGIILSILSAILSVYELPL